jgi:hypothetical protein
MSTPETVTVATRNSTSFVLGILALLLGVGGLLVGWIPYLGLLAVPVAAVGLLLAFLGVLIALFKRMRGAVMPLVGGLVSTGALVLSVVTTTKTAESINQQIGDARARAAAGASPEALAYIAGSLELYEVDAQYRDQALGGRVPGLTFKLRNNGDRTLGSVKVAVYFLDAAGARIAEETFLPVQVSSFSSTASNNPLRLGYVWQMERGKFYACESVPDEWQPGADEAEVVDISFADSAPAAPDPAPPAP